MEICQISTEHTQCKEIQVKIEFEIICLKVTPVAVLQSSAQGLETGYVSREFENPEDP